MTIPIKIECGCGQRYAFDVEAVGGRMPTPVACPTCSADGTAVANTIIAQTMVPKPALALAGGLSLRGATPTLAVENFTPTAPAEVTTHRANKRLPGQLDRPQAEHEARAKILWGDSPADVSKFLMMHGFGHEEASNLVQSMFLERAVTIRSNGIKKIFTGCGLMCVPVIAFFVFLGMGFFPLKIFAVTVMVGVWGAWTVIKGTIMMLAPKSEPGDVSEQ